MSLDAILQALSYDKKRVRMNRMESSIYSPLQGGAMTTNCPEYEKNLEFCPCTSLECARRGHCCQCIKAHVARGSLPACARHLGAA